MHRLHKTLLDAIKKHGAPGMRSAMDSYIASGHDYYNVTVPVRRALAREWLKERKTLVPNEFLAVLASLFQGKSHEEKTMASLLLAYNTDGRAAVGISHIDAWLDHLVGWAEIDSLCSNVFKPEELLADWAVWQRFLKRLSGDKNINKRRAALVFLTGPVRYSNDKRLANASLAIIDSLKHERDILITKAVSWLLRSMVTRHKKRVADYVEQNALTLPAIAVRETRTKLRTGRKNPRRGRT